MTPVSGLINIPTGAPIYSGVLISTLCRSVSPGGSDAGDFMYLQSLRSKVLAAITANPYNSLLARSYRANLPGYLKALIAVYSTPFDAIVAPPSRRRHSRPYRLAFANAFPSAIDVTDRFSRRRGTSACLAPSFSALHAAIRYRCKGDETSLRSVLFIDDILSTGTTAAVVCSHLQAAGMSASAQFQIACALWFA